MDGNYVLAGEPKLHGIIVLDPLLKPDTVASLYLALTLTLDLDLYSLSTFFIGVRFVHRATLWNLHGGACHYPHTTFDNKSYWHTWQPGFHGKTCTASPQGDLMTPTILNIVVDTAVRH